MTLCDPTAEPSVPTSSTGSPGRAQQLPRAPTASCSKWRLLRQFYNWSPLSSWGDSAFLFNSAFIWLLFFFFFLFPFIFRVSLFGGFFFPPVVFVPAVLPCGSGGGGKRWARGSPAALSARLPIYSPSLTDLQRCREFCNSVLGTESCSVYCQTKFKWVSEIFASLGL